MTDEGLSPNQQEDGQDYFQVLLTLFPKEKPATILPIPTPAMARGLLFELLATIDTGIVTQLHDRNEIRPYAIQRRVDWELEGSFPAREQGAHTSRPFKSVTFSINIFRSDILQVLQRRLLQRQNGALQLGEHAYVAGEVSFHRRPFPDLFLPGSRLPQSYHVAFLTPTYFATTRGSFPLRFPAPEVLAGNLSRLWNAFQIGDARVEPEPLLDWVNRGITLTSFNLRTKPWSVGKPTSVAGVVGWARYRVVEAHPSFEAWWHALLRLGEVTNVGRSRTAGAGHIRVGK